MSWSHSHILIAGREQSNTVLNSFGIILCDINVDVEQTHTHQQVRYLISDGGLRERVSASQITDNHFAIVTTQTLDMDNMLH